MVFEQLTADEEMSNKMGKLCSPQQKPYIAAEILQLLSINPVPLNTGKFIGKWFNSGFSLTKLQGSLENVAKYSAILELSLNTNKPF